MKRSAPGMVFIGLLMWVSCARSAARSEKCFDDIRQMVAGKTAAEVEALLGEPDSRKPILIHDERWVWWNYTFLDGDSYPPEIRGQVVHLEITFERPGDANGDSPPSYAGWRISDPLGVSYTIPAKDL